mgnify:CR=1 FL=1
MLRSIVLAAEVAQAAIPSFPLVESRTAMPWVARRGWIIEDPAPLSAPRWSDACIQLCELVKERVFLGRKPKSEEDCHKSSKELSGLEHEINTLKDSEVS